MLAEPEQGATFPMLLSLANGLTLLACVLVVAAGWTYRRRRIRGASLRSPEPSGAFYVWVLGIVLIGFALLAVSVHA
jgi:amino acid transporter